MSTIFVPSGTLSKPKSVQTDAQLPSQLQNDEKIRVQAAIAQAQAEIPSDEVERVRAIVEQQAQYVYDPEKWAYDIVGFEADKWQSAAFENFVEHRFLAISTGTGTGKTALCAILVLFFLSTRPFPKVPCTAPSKSQLFGALWAEIGKWRRKSPMLMEMFKWTQTTVKHREYPENWWAVARTARLQSKKDTVESMQGFHEKHILMLVDEASGVPDQVMNAVDGAITTEGAHVLLASNPTRRVGYFFRTITDPRLRVENGGSFKIMHVSAEEAKYCHPQHISRAIEIYGIDSDFYRVKVKGLPPRAESSQLITPEQVYAAHQRFKEEEKAQKEREDQRKVAFKLLKAKHGNESAERIEQVADAAVLPVQRQNIKDTVYQIPNETMVSCDPARYGDDPTVFLVRVNQNIVRYEVLRKTDTMQVAHIGFELIKEYKADHICIDVIGIGSGVVDRTKQLLRTYNDRAKQLDARHPGTDTTLKTILHEVHVGHKPIPETLEEKKKNPSELGYFNLRSQLFWSTRTQIDMIAICFESEILDEELQSLHYGWNQQDSKIRLESKDEIKKEIGRSPNFADAFALLFYPDLLARVPELVYSASSFGIGTTSSDVPVDAHSKNDMGSGQTGFDPDSNRMGGAPTFGFISSAIGARRYSSLKSRFTNF